MGLNNLILILILISFTIFFYRFFVPLLNRYNTKLLVDDQFSKPQAFHEKAISTSGGLYIFSSFLIVLFNFFFFKQTVFLEYLSFCTLFFIIGFIDDIKINVKAKIRLLLMIVGLIFLVKYNNFYIYKTGIEFLNIWLQSSNIFSLIFISLCFLFVVNGANLIDGYNGLLGIHSLIILINLFFINYLSGNNDLANIIFFAIVILIFFLVLNFPKAKVFLGDGGSYFLGSFLAISVIITSIENPNISPFYFCIILFYLFFEVFFSFFRKLVKERKSPIQPDKKHLHMLIYKLLLKKNNNKLKSNYQVSVIINLIYLLLIIPAVFMMNDGIFCKYYSILFFVFYFFSYKITYKKNKKL